jgi:hypothetical protein
MKITEVSTVVRYSAEAKGAWRSIEVGATATLTASDETLEAAQQELYHRLSRQLKTLWANGNGKAEAQEQPSNGSQTPAPPHEHWCQEHNQEFKARVNKQTGETFYSHRQGGGWHNESA